MTRIKHFFKRLNSIVLMFMAVGYGPGVLDWPTYQADNRHDGYISVEAVSKGEPSVNWSKSVENGSFDDPIYQDGIAYFTVKTVDKFTIFAYQKTDGSLLWQYQGEGTLNSSMVVHSDYLFVPSAELLILNAKTGELISEIANGERASYPEAQNLELFFWSKIASGGYGLNCYEIPLTVGAEFSKKWSKEYPSAVEVSYPIIYETSSLTAMYADIAGMTHIDSLDYWSLSGGNGEFEVEARQQLITNQHFISSLSYLDYGYFLTDNHQLAVVDFWEDKINLFDEGDISLPAINDWATYYIREDLGQMKLRRLVIGADDEGWSTFNFSEKSLGLGSIDIGAHPIIVGDELFYLNANKILVYNLVDETFVWKEVIGAKNNLSSLIYADGDFIAVGSDKQTIYAFDFDPNLYLAETTIELDSPYTCTDCRQYLGQTHSHYISDVKVPWRSDNPALTVEKYRDRGYDFVTLTEHNALTSDPGTSGITFINQGEEDTQEGGGNHILGVGINSPADETKSDQERINQFHNQGGFVSLAHPDSFFYEWPLSKLMGVNNYDAIEVYNSGIGHGGNFVEFWGWLGKGEVKNTAFAFDKWDELLKSRHKVWATAGDDYTPGNLGFDGASVLVEAKDKSQDSIVNALGKGSFYALEGSASPRINVKTAGSIITVTSSEESRIKFIGQNGKIITQSSRSSVASYTVSGDEIYVRVEVEGKDGTAWSQPVFVNQVARQTVGPGPTKMLLGNTALSASTTGDLTAEVLSTSSSQMPSTLPTWGLYSPIYNFETTGAFESGELAINYEGLSLPFSPNNLAIYTYDEIAQTWQKLASSVVDTTNKLVSAILPHFSLYALSADPPADVLPPTLVLTAPTDLNLSGLTELDIDSTDDSQTISISAFLDDAIFLFEDSDYSDGFINSVNFSNYPAGSHQLTLIAEDASGNKTEKSYDIMTVENDFRLSVDNITVAQNSLCTTATINANYFSSNALADASIWLDGYYYADFNQVEGGILSQTIDLSLYQKDNYVLTIKATDTLGNEVQSEMSLVPLCKKAVDEPKIIGRDISVSTSPANIVSTLATASSVETNIDQNGVGDNLKEDNLEKNQSTPSAPIIKSAETGYDDKAKLKKSKISLLVLIGVFLVLVLGTILIKKRAKKSAKSE